ncbi:hypothetical protein HPB50_014809 [Hyalomma asiaticum]|uniref:Uncharacterized protein n=1 Tax=Hyalomma asiaticum TaxID=266040 RepID=A0ACB7SHB4_HYAAI|nr:hypothetical protein HPB50_014809 [Hyalomma asiaticum]
MSSSVDVIVDGKKYSILMTKPQLDQILAGSADVSAGDRAAAHVDVDTDPLATAGASATGPSESSNLGGSALISQATATVSKVAAAKRTATDTVAEMMWKIPQDREHDNADIKDKWM